MISDNPFAVFRSECQRTLEEALKDLFPDIQFHDMALEKPPNPDFGQLASSLCFELAKQTGEKPLALAERVAKSVDKSKFCLVCKVAAAGGGYVNFHADFAGFSALVIESARELDTQYGFVKTEKPLKTIVEHTSVNPLHPIHIGQARNPMLGDALARLLSARGHKVSRHYYIDDVGRQSSVVAYGYDKLRRPRSEGKADQFIGRVYTITSCLAEINRLKRELDRAKTASAEEEIAKINKDLDEWMAIAIELREKHRELFDLLTQEICKDENPEKMISNLNQSYEAGSEDAKKLVREVSELCLQGFRETLGRAGISYDSWDWESDLVWDGNVAETLEKLKRSPYLFTEGGVFEFDAQKVILDLGLKQKLGLREDHAVPPLTLMRADGTTLYTTRDIAYALWKFERAGRVINVIGAEQNLAQLQLRTALYALGYDKYADNLVHFSHNLVTLPGYKMSSRRGHYITFDEVMDEAVRRAYEEVTKRSPQLSEKERQKIADFVGVGAVRYALVGVDPSKPVVFTWDRVLDFEKNSAPYIQYTHARASSILRKAGRKPEKPDYALLEEKIEHEVVLSLASFPDVFVEAAEMLSPSLIADYANGLADKFNTFYNALPVIRADPPGLGDARLALVEALRVVLRNALTLIGVFAPERM
jgi:arginyl-tRNA synthetase